MTNHFPSDDAIYYPDGRMAVRDRDWLREVRNLCRIPVVRALFKVAFCLALFFTGMGVLALMTIVWDYSQVPSKKAEYKQVALGMTEDEVLARLGPCDSVCVIQRRQVKQRTWALNHYEDGRIEFDQQGVVVEIREPMKLADRFPTLTRINGWYESHSSRFRQDTREVLQALDLVK